MLDLSELHEQYWYHDDPVSEVNVKFNRLSPSIAKHVEHEETSDKLRPHGSHLHFDSVDGLDLLFEHILIDHILFSHTRRRYTLISSIQFERLFEMACKD